MTDAWTDEDMQKPLGAEMAFLRHLANDPALNPQQQGMLRHCAKMLGRQAAVEGAQGASVRNVMQAHQESAERANFKRCGCDYCDALRETPTPATGSGGEAVYQIRTGDGRGWIDETKAVYDWWNGSEDAPPRRILYTHPAPAGGDAGDAERLDWMMLHVSGKELRDMGIDTFDGCTRARIDAAMGLTAKPGAEGSALAPGCGDGVGNG